MAICFGLAPGAGGWHLAVLETGPAGGAPAVQQTRTAEPAHPRAGRDFFAWCEELVPCLAAGSRESACDESTIVHELRKQIVLANLWEIYDEQETYFGWGQPAAVGVCHPYAASPLVRRALPVLFDGEPVVPPLHPDFNAPAPARAGDGARLCALESPLAACLDLAGSRAVRVPADLLLLAGAAARPELTRVHVACQRDHLVFKMEQTRQLAAPDAGASFERQVRSIAAGQDADFRSRLRLVVYGNHLRGVAAAVARAAALSQDGTLYQDESSLAAGAARYAAACIARGLHGGGVQAAGWRVEHVVPRDVGVICTGRGGGAFWCQVFARGARLPAESPAIRVSGPMPTEITLAERCDESLGGFTWLEEGAWQPSALRWLASVRMTSDDGNSASQFALRMENPSGRPEYGWSDLTAEALPR